MAETEQARPLAQVEAHPSNDEEVSIKKMRRKRKIKMCVYGNIAFTLLGIILNIILANTVFKVKDPKVTTNGITLTNLDFKVVQTSTLQVEMNMSMLVDMSIKNPNIASFKLGNSTTTVYYRGVAVADVLIPPGLVKARRTSRLNATLVIMADRLGSSPDLLADVRNGEMNLSSYSVIPGRVKILFIKKHVEVGMDCNVTVNIISRETQDMICKVR